jgi:hypothetical protein
MLSTPTRLIYTRHGIKRIDDIVLGDELLTAEGEFNRVSRLLRNTYRGQHDRDRRKAFH